MQRKFPACICSSGLIDTFAAVLRRRSLKMWLIDVFLIILGHQPTSSWSTTDANIILYRLFRSVELITQLGI